MSYLLEMISTEVGVDLSGKSKLNLVKFYKKHCEKVWEVCDRIVESLFWNVKCFKEFIGN